MALPRASRPRDPDALRRATWALVAVVLLWPLLVLAEFKPGALFDAGNLKVMGGFLGRLPAARHLGEFLALLLKATMETLAMATAGTALAMLLAVPLGVRATAQPVDFTHRARPGRGAGERLRAVARALLLVLRAIPEIVWALLLVRAFGLGPGGRRAGDRPHLRRHAGQGLCRDPRIGRHASGARAARSRQRPPDGVFYGLLPGAAQELASYTVYRWECAVRASVIMGFVGAGGLGQLMDQSMKMLNGGEVSTILIIFLLLVLLADALSAAVRRLLAGMSADATLSPSGARALGFCLTCWVTLRCAGRRLGELRLPVARFRRACSAPSRGARWRDSRASSSRPT